MLVLSFHFGFYTHELCFIDPFVIPQLIQNYKPVLKQLEVLKVILIYLQ